MSNISKLPQKSSSISEEKTTLQNIINVFSQKALDISKIFSDLVLLDLSFTQSISNLKFYNDWSNPDCTGKICYFNLTDGSKEASFICPEDIFIKSNRSYEFSLKKSVDVRIDKMTIGNNGKITIRIKSIREHGISANELVKRKITEYCKKNNFFDMRNMEMPIFVSNIALLTTNTGNTASDIMKQSGLRKEHMKLFTCNSDGVSIANALKAIINSKKYQLVCLFRGGNEDKFMINFSMIPVLNEVVASPIPIASAIGHQVDKPIIQAVVDMGFDTPSSFARAVRENNLLLKSTIKEQLKSICKNTSFSLKKQKDMVISIRKGIDLDISVLIEKEKNRKKTKQIVNLVLIIIVIAIAFLITVFNLFW